MNALTAWGEVFGFELLLLFVRPRGLTATLVNRQGDVAREFTQGVIEHGNFTVGY